MKKKETYNNQSITSLKGADRVRKRPAVIFGSDAHQPEMVWNPAAHEKAMEIVRKNHLHLIDTVDFVKPVLD